MSLFHRVGLLFRTIKFLKFEQIFFRILKRFKSKKIFVPQKVELSNRKPIQGFFRKKQSIFEDNQFFFLNKKEELSFPNDWYSEGDSLLWKYNLHYFDGLISDNTAPEVKTNLVNMWISSNSNRYSIGWNSYPLSLRITNWIKWAWIYETKLDIKVSNSLYSQAKFLSKNLEYHLLGNHLLENSKALIFAGYFFKGKEAELWLAKGIKILKKEFERQILDDGGHFELSPMYHSIILELIHDIYLLSISIDAPRILNEQSKFLKSKMISMTNWLEKMIHHDGDIALFNDAAFGIAIEPRILIDKIKKDFSIKLNEISDCEFLEDTGYLRLSKGESILFFDLAEIGARYLPGHGHADTLSIELSVFGQRLITNLGTSEYGNGQRRIFERSTKAHSTVELNDQNSSEVWDGFRVGRRAKVFDLKIQKNKEKISVEAKHNGYRFLKRGLIHKRKIELFEDSLVIYDQVTKNVASYLSRFHIHPCIKIELIEEKNGKFIFPNNDVVFWEAKTDEVLLKDVLFAPQFNILQNTKTLILKNNKSIDTMLKIYWKK